MIVIEKSKREVTEWNGRIGGGIDLSAWVSLECYGATPCLPTCLLQCGQPRL